MCRRNHCDKGSRSESGAEVGYSRTALVHACIHGSEETIVLLLQSGMDINEVARDGMTALMHACFVASTEIVTLLINFHWPIRVRLLKTKLLSHVSCV